jgi:hypothetical protein
MFGGRFFCAIEERKKLMTMIPFSSLHVNKVDQNILREQQYSKNSIETKVV